MTAPATIAQRLLDDKEFRLAVARVIWMLESPGTHPVAWSSGPGGGGGGTYADAAASKTMVWSGVVGSGGSNAPYSSMSVTLQPPLEWSEPKPAYEVEEVTGEVLPRGKTAERDAIVAADIEAFPGDTNIARARRLREALGFKSDGSASDYLSKSYFKRHPKEAS